VRVVPSLRSRVVRSCRTGPADGWATHRCDGLWAVRSA